MRHSFTPTLSELQAFRACAESGSVTRAAEQLHLSQSAVSRALASLETRLGVLLFARVNKRLVLSDVGRAMLRDTEHVIADLNAAALTVMSYGNGSNVLRLAVLPTFGTSWLIPRLADFKRHEPHVSLDIAARLQAVDFDREPFDAALQRSDLAAAGTRTVTIATETLITVASPALAAGAPLPDEAIARLPLLQQATRPELWLDWFRNAGLDSIAISRGPRFEHFGMVLAAARAGLGVALVPAVIAERDLNDGTLVRLSLREDAGRSDYTLIYPERSEGNATLVRFRDWLALQS